MNSSGQPSTRETRRPVGPGKVDGRIARSIRTRTAIIDAMLALIEEGELQPTAARVAERAGISERLIYHHFDDLEALLAAVAERQSERVIKRVRPIDAARPLPDRIHELVEQRAALFEWITPFRRAAMLHEPFSPALRERRDQVLAHNRRQLTEVFRPELRALPVGARRELLAALDATTSWAWWDAVRGAGLSAAAARRAMHRTIAALLT